MESTLFTKLSLSEEASLSGGGHSYPVYDNSGGAGGAGGAGGSIGTCVIVKNCIAGDGGDGGAGGAGGGNRHLRK